jgi:hypothetical protein
MCASSRGLRLGAAQGDVAGEVAVARVAGALDFERQGACRRRQQLLRERVERAAQQSFDRLFHGSPANCRPRSVPERRPAARLS